MENDGEEKKEAGKSSPGPTEESGEETARRLLRAAGGSCETPPPLQDAEGHLREMERHLQLLIADSRKEIEAVGKSRKEVEQSRKEADDIVRRVELFCQEKLPHLVVASLDRAGEIGINACLLPVRGEVNALLSGLQEQRRELRRFFWRALQLLGGVTLLATIIGGIIGGVIVCHYLQPGAPVATRYDAWGRKIQDTVERASPRDRERFYRWAGRP